MLFDVFSPHFPVTEALKGHIRACFEPIVLRYDDRIRVLKVRLMDVNGPRGGEDKVCHLQVDVDHHPTVNTEGRHTDLYTAITLAARRMERSLAPVLDGTRSRNPNSRHAGRADNTLIRLERPILPEEQLDGMPSVQGWRPCSNE